MRVASPLYSLCPARRQRRRHAIDREILLRVLTLNLMIVRRLKPRLQQGKTVSTSGFFLVGLIQM